MTPSCCGPSAQRRPADHLPETTGMTAHHGVDTTLGELVELSGGTFLMGSDDALAYPDDGEGPVRAVSVAPFSIQTSAVTNAQFAAFVDITGHVSEAESFGWSFVFGGLLPDDFPTTRGVAATPWWRQVEGATWDSPAGPLGLLTADPQHPAVHVSWNDAVAFAEWAGGRLPSEAEWEYAARGGLVQQPFPWGDELEPDGQHLMNVWQGDFPISNALSDGWYGTAPVRSYPPNAYGLHDMTGNVWEWTADWFEPGASRAARGGSYLCHASYCRRYRVSARQGMSPDSTTGNTGFRCVVGTT